MPLRPPLGVPPFDVPPLDMPALPPLDMPPAPVAVPVTQPGGVYPPSVAAVVAPSTMKDFQVLTPV
jgi:hypothetical protein